MNKIDIAKKELFDLLELITEQTEMLKLHKGEIPQLYIDLLKKNVLKFYESINTIDQIKHLAKSVEGQKEVQPAVTKPEIKKEIIKEAPKVADVKEEAFEKIHEVKTPVELQTPKPEIKSTPEENIEPEKEEEEKPLISFSINHAPDIPKEKEIFIHPDSDLFTEPKPSVADKLSAKKDPTLGDKMQQNQINSIKSAIGINDKFLFINELFEGDLKIYNQAVDQLNLARNKDEAMTSFTTFKEKFKWEEKGEAVKKLKTILNRKFSVV